LLTLPSDIVLSKSSISNLRLTIPADIYQSSISIEIKGIHVQGNIRSDTNANRGTDTPKKTPESTSIESDVQRDIGTLPKPEDLAKSFLRTEAPEEQAELQAAISSQSQLIDESSVLETEEGLGGGYSLPGFLAGFLQGISDRLEIHIRDVEVDVDMDLQSETNASNIESLEPDLITLRLRVEGLYLGPDTLHVPQDASNLSTIQRSPRGQPSKFSAQPQDLEQKENGRRQISITNISCWLISDPSIFAGLAKSSGRSSPSVTYSDRKRLGHRNQSRSGKPYSAYSDRGTPSPRSHRGHSSGASNQSVAYGDGVGTMSGSILSSDEDRFADAGEDESLGGSNIYQADQSHDSNTAEDLYDDSTYLDQVSASQLQEHQMETFESTLDSIEDRPTTHRRQQDFENEGIEDELESPGRSTLREALFKSRTLGTRSPEESQDYKHKQSSETFLSAISQPAETSQDVLKRPVEESDDFLRGFEDQDDDLSKSKIFSPDEVKSLYMSAFSSAPEAHQNMPMMPGAWNEEKSKMNAEPRTEPRTPSPKPIVDSHREVHSPDRQIDRSRSDSLRIDRSQNSTPTNASPNVIEKNSLNDQLSSPRQGSELSSTSEQYQKVAKNVLYVDKVDIHMPGRIASQSPSLDPANQVPSTSTTRIPGSFSTDSTTERGSYRDPQSSIFGNLEESMSGSSSQDNKLQENSYPSQPEVNLGTLRIQFDVTIARLVYQVCEKLATTFISTEAKDKETTMSKETKSTTSITLTAERISVKLLERLGAAHLSSSQMSDMSALIGKSSVKPPLDDVLLRLTLKGLRLNTHAEGPKAETLVQLEKFVFGYARENIISFDASRKMRASTRDVLSPYDRDITINITRSNDSNRIFLSTLPIHISIDLLRLDETLGWFGGVSSVIGMGNSIVSNATIRGTSSSSPTKTKTSKGVRFEGAKEKSVKPQSSGPQIKFDARIGAISVDLISRDCTITAITSALKVVNRGETIGAQIDKIRLSGPLPHHRESDPCLLATVSNVRIEYLATPKESDLSRLLSLLTPSNNKYDQDDDIILDTLLRQRRQGAVLRLSVSSVRGHLATQDGLECLPALVDEIGKLSSVTKYLPDDDRPGLLSLVHVGEVNLRLVLGGVIGDLLVTLKGLEIAHVSIPALAATSVQGIHVQSGEDEDDLVGEAVPMETSETQENTPMFMARMIGDEMEPVIKVKLWNIRLEYRVSLIMNLFGISEEMTTEEAIGNIAGSVATLRLPHESIENLAKPANLGPRHEKAEDYIKPLKLEIILRDTVAGLNPLGMSSKALVVFTETRIALALPKDQSFQVSIEINNASLLVIDDLSNMLSIEDVRSGSNRHSLHSPSPQISDLCASGFVSVSNMRSAQALISICNDDITGDKYVDIELKDELLVLETCADSTQTLVNIIEGLQPPRPPSTDVKYRTEIVPVEDMLASLSGNAFTSNPEDDYVDEFPLGLDDDDIVDDDVPENMEFVSSFYQPGPDSTSEDVADSMPSEDLGNRALAPTAQDLKDKVLLENFEEQYRSERGEPLDFRDDHFGTGSVIDGKAHRWDSVQNAYGQTNDYKLPGSPLKVRVRDVHIIWNLFDGYDWQKTRDKISKTVKDLEFKALERRSRGNPRVALEDQQEEEAVIGDFLFNSIYIGIPANRDPRELANMINREVDDLASDAESYTASVTTNTTARQGHGPRTRNKKLSLSRSKHHKLTFELRGVSADLVVFPPGSGETQSSIDLRVRDFEIFDHVPTSTWKKFATYMHDAGEREIGTSMIHLELLTVKPIPDLAASEIVLKVG
jgi:autophagy-related protein 2